jgi:hypothetical protein
MKSLSQFDLLKAVNANDYIIVRHCNGKVMGVNCRIAREISLFKYGASHLVETNYISFRKCSFNEYISKKTPFIKS